MNNIQFDASMSTANVASNRPIKKFVKANVSLNSENISKSESSIEKQIGDLVEKEYQEIVFDKDGKYDTVEFISHKKTKRKRSKTSSSVANSNSKEKTNSMEIDLTIDDNDNKDDFVKTKSKSKPNQTIILIDDEKEEEKNDMNGKQKNMNVTKNNNSNHKHKSHNTNNNDSSEKTTKKNKSSKLERTVQCNLCKVWLDKTTTLEEHLRSVPHLFSANGAKETSAVFHLTEQNKGWQIIAKDGWDRTGLGPNQEGITEPVQLRVNDGRLGIGLNSKRKRKTLNDETLNNIQNKNDENMSKKQRKEHIEQEKEKEKFLHSVIYE